MDLTGDILAEAERTGSEDVDQCIRQTTELIWQTCRDAGVERPLGVGLCLPGVIDRAEGVVKKAVHLSWRDVPIAPKLRESLQGIPVVLENASNCAAFAEEWYAGGGSVGDLLYLRISHAVGSGLILGGRLLTRTVAGGTEIGHMVIEPGGPICRCGRRGCLEALVSELLAEGARDALPQGGVVELQERTARAAAEGDKDALERVIGIARYCGTAVANVVNLTGVRHVVVESPLLMIDAFLDVVRHSVQSEVLPGEGDAVHVRASRWGGRSPAIGGACLVAYQSLSPEHVFESVVELKGLGA
ncbi:ROK family protein [Geochorda subterranea]|uniref:ROK family protein n=1 Tax=Geochorda subterranea TaxID=3109564 RepID=A0ABZ1BMM9_9FIRM|nr:ROK family protein [Limnochorda sp. LNt]WRP13745.1 ROK family protein [Limnochorda sp. LNt]